MIQKNTASQGVYLFAYNSSGPVTGDASNISGYVSKDGGAAAAFGTAHPTEISASNMKGVYWQPLAQGETNADALALSWASSTTGVSVDPLVVLTDRSGVQIAQAQVLQSPRDCTSVADASLQVGDALHAAVAIACGQRSFAGTAWTIKTPAGTTVAARTTNSATSPTAIN